MLSANALEREEWSWHPGLSLLKPFYRCPISSASFLCYHDLLEPKYWPPWKKVCYINMYKKEELWNKSSFCLLLFSFSSHFLELISDLKNPLKETWSALKNGTRFGDHLCESEYFVSSKFKSKHQLWFNEPVWYWSWKVMVAALLSEFLISFTGHKMIDFQQHDSQRYRLVTINHF